MYGFLDRLNKEGKDIGLDIGDIIFGIVAFGMLFRNAIITAIRSDPDAILKKVVYTDRRELWLDRIAELFAGIFTMLVILLYPVGLIFLWYYYQQDHTVAYQHAERMQTAEMVTANICMVLGLLYAASSSFPSTERDGETSQGKVVIKFLLSFILVLVGMYINSFGESPYSDIELTWRFRTTYDIVAVLLYAAGLGVLLTIRKHKKDYFRKTRRELYYLPFLMAVFLALYSGFRYVVTDGEM